MTMAAGVQVGAQSFSSTMAGLREQPQGSAAMADLHHMQQASAVHRCSSSPEYLCPRRH